MELKHTLEFLLKNGAKLEVHNEKLKVNISPAFMTSEMQLFIKTNKEQITDILIKGKNLKKAPEADTYPLSSIQRQFYFLNQLDNQSLAYNLQHFLEIEGELDKERLTKVFETLIQRHEILRTTFHVIEGEVCQKIHETTNFEFVFSKATPDNLEHQLKEFIRPFNLENAPLLRAELLELDVDKHVLMVDLHHIVTDGVSSGLLIYEIAALYNGDELQDQVLQYKDYAVWQQSDAYQIVNISHKEFWMNDFSGNIPDSNLPLDFKRGTEKAKGIRNFELTKEQTLSLKEISKSERTTQFNLLLALFGMFISKLSNQEQLVLGTPTSGRTMPSLEHIVGVFLNSLPIRLKCPNDTSFKEYLKAVGNKVLDCLEHQSYPFEDIVNQLEIERHANKSPLFTTMFNYENFEVPQFEMKGLKVRALPNNNDTPGFDLNLIASENFEKYTFKFVYDANLFKSETIDSFVRYFQKIIDKVIESVEVKTGMIEIISKDDKDQLLQQFNNTSKEFASGKLILDMFNFQLTTNPDTIAVECPSGEYSAFVVYDDEKLTFKELETKSNQLANYLLNNGCSPGDIVPICMDCSINFVVGVLAILKAGCAYVPIDQNYPENRISYILNDIKAKLILSSSDSKDISQIVETTEFLLVDKIELDVESVVAPEITIKPDTIAYVIYTSGTTGNPKGVMVDHAALYNYINCSKELYVEESPSNFPLFTSISFDLTVTSLFTPLATGNTIVVYNDEDVSQRMERIFKENKVQIVKLTPSHMLMIKDMLESSKDYEVKSLIFGGERLDAKLCNDIKELMGSHINIFNEYGPTENTVGCVVHKYDHSVENSIVPVGRPISNTSCYVLNRNMELVPKGFTGELYLGGEQLAQGYLNQPKLSQERFVENPFDSTSKIYKTGDLARWLPDGNLEYLGRIDDQVKIRGHRIEVGEIESALAKLEEIQNAVLFVKTVNDNVTLTAFYVAKEELDKKYMKAHLLKYIHSQVMPNMFIHLDELPITVNGKINHKALDALASKAKEITYVAPSNEVEEKLVKVWFEILGIEEAKISVEANFFELGGHSLAVISMSNKILKLFGVELTIKDVFANPTISGLAHFISNHLWFAEKSHDDEEVNEITI